MCVALGTACSTSSKLARWRFSGLNGGRKTQAKDIGSNVWKQNLETGKGSDCVCVCVVVIFSLFALLLLHVITIITRISHPPLTVNSAAAETVSTSVWTIHTYFPECFSWMFLTIRSPAKPWWRSKTKRFRKSPRPWSLAEAGIPPTERACWLIVFVVAEEQ